VQITSERVARKRNLRGKLLLSAAGLVGLAAPIGIGLVRAPRGLAQSPKTNDAPLPSFEVASVKPNRSGDSNIGYTLPPGRFKATNVTTKFLIQFAYNVKHYQVSGEPKLGQLGKI